MARRRMKGSAIWRISTADIRRVVTAALLEGVLQREAVDHGREQAHVVAGHAVDALRRRRDAPDDVAAAEDDRGLDAQGVDVLDLVGEPRDHVRRDAEPLVPHQRLPRQLQEDAAVDGRASAIVAGLQMSPPERPSRPAPASVSEADSPSRAGLRHSYAIICESGAAA